MSLILIMLVNGAIEHCVDVDDESSSDNVRVLVVCLKQQASSVNIHLIDYRLTWASQFQILLHFTELLIAGKPLKFVSFARFGLMLLINFDDNQVN